MMYKKGLSEKETYIVAIIIVVLGTLVIATGFTLGLLFLTGSDDREIQTDLTISFDIEKTEIIDLSADIDIISEDWILSVDIQSFDETDIEVISISSDDSALISSDIDEVRIEDPDELRVGNNRWILIDKSNFTLTLYVGNRVIYQWRIAVGLNDGDKQRKGDNRTPNGVFTVRQIQDSSKWVHDFGDGNGLIEGAYGPWFIRLHTPPWTGIGIHGTHDPDSIGSRSSEGCIRMNNEDVIELKRLVRIGMPVVVIE